MDKEAIFSKLKDICKIVLGQANQNKEINYNTRIVEDLGLNSVAVVYIVFALEKEFNISFNKVSVNYFKTIGDLVNFIYNQLQ